MHEQHHLLVEQRERLGYFPRLLLEEMAERIGCYVQELYALTDHELHDLALMLDEREVSNADAVS